MLLVRIPLEVPWGLLLWTALLILLPLVVGGLFLFRETAKVDPNAVVRDNGSP